MENAGNQLKAEIKKIGITQEEAAGRLGVTRQTLQNWFKLPEFDANTVLCVKKNLQISIDVADEELALHEQSNAGGDEVIAGKIIPLYDAEASAGKIGGMDMAAVSRPMAMIEIGSILADSEVALRVHGNSMVPNYPAGCILGLRPNRDSFIEPGRVYVVETMEDRYLKRLHYNKDRSALRCISDNHMTYDDGPMKGEFCYPEFEIPFDEVRRLFRVVGVIKRNIL